MFRRKKADEAEGAEEALETDQARERRGPRANGPWDASEVTIDEEDDAGRVDLGSLLLTPHEGVELQLQVDETSNEVVAVIMAGDEGAAELRAFAAPRNGDIWDDVRKAVAGEVAQMGGTATERQGPYGTELTVSLSVELPDGGHAQQESLVVGIPGPRWLLRATLFGRPAVEHHRDGDVETAMRDVVVVRGGTPLPPGDALPLTMPPHAHRAEPPPE